MVRNCDTFNTEVNIDSLLDDSSHLNQFSKHLPTLIFSKVSKKGVSRQSFTNCGKLCKHLLNVDFARTANLLSIFVQLCV